MTLPPRRGVGLRRGRLVALLAVGAAGLCAAFAATWAEPARSDATDGSFAYTDASGDTAGAPDLGAVTVATGADGVITFSVAAPSFPAATLPAGGWSAIDVFLDTDQNLATGDDDGWDYALRAARQPGRPQVAYLFKWDGTQYTRVPAAPSVAIGGAGDAVTLTVAPPDLGGATGFDFLLVAANFNGAGNPYQYDFAPDHGRWRYPEPAPTTTGAATTETATTTTAPTTTVAPPPPARLVIGPAATQPAAPVAGTAFRAAFSVTLDGVPPKGAHVRARATVGGRAVASKARLGRGSVVVTVDVPAAAARKRLTIALAASAGGKNAAAAETFPVKPR